MSYLVRGENAPNLEPVCNRCTRGLRAALGATAHVLRDGGVRFLPTTRRRYKSSLRSASASVSGRLTLRSLGTSLKSTESQKLWFPAPVNFFRTHISIKLLLYLESTQSSRRRMHLGGRRKTVKVCGLQGVRRQRGLFRYLGRFKYIGQIKAGGENHACTASSRN